MLYLDTHAVIWLYEGKTELFTDSGQRHIEQENLLISPFVLLELDYLQEVKKIKQKGKKIVATLGSEIDLRICKLPLSDIINAASHQSWTREPFDRLLVSQCVAKGNEKLLTRDENIRKNYKMALW